MHVGMRCSSCNVGQLLEGQASTLNFWLNQNRTSNQSTHYSGCDKIDCHGVAITNQDTSTHLVAQSRCGSTHEALGSVAAPQVSDEHHDKVKTQKKHSNPINARGKKEDEEPDYIHNSFPDA